jgi:hypothetical protein
MSCLKPVLLALPTATVQVSVDAVDAAAAAVAVINDSSWPSSSSLRS